MESACLTESGQRPEGSERASRVYSVAAGARLPRLGKKAKAVYESLHTFWSVIGSYSGICMRCDRCIFAGQMAVVRSGARGWGSRGEYVGKWQRAFREAVAQSGVDMVFMLDT